MELPKLAATSIAPSADSAPTLEPEPSVQAVPGPQGKPDLLKVMVLLSPDGAVLSTKGDDAEEFAAVAAYASQLARLVGEGLGLEGFRELGCEFKKGRCLIYLDENGNTVGVRPRPEIPMTKIREMLGFV